MWRRRDEEGRVRRVSGRREFEGSGGGRKAMSKAGGRGVRRNPKIGAWGSLGKGSLLLQAPPHPVPSPHLYPLSQVISISSLTAQLRLLIAVGSA